MAIKGSWQAKRTGNVGYVGAARWGTGVNSVHAIRGNGGRNIAPGVATDVIEPDLVDQYAPSQFGYADEDSPDKIFGYGTETGTADRPSIGDSDAAMRVATSQRFPAWGSKRGGLPGGSRVRAENHGADAGITSRLPQREAAPDFMSKEDTYVNNPTLAAETQIFRQTSMQQQDRTRAGSQSSGTASEYSAPIPSRIPGMRWQRQSGGYRHAEMEPREQRPIRRPFFVRNAGTGPAHHMEPNAMYVSDPIQRTPPADPNTGHEAGTILYGNEHGYVDEDMTW